MTKRKAITTAMKVKCLLSRSCVYCTDCNNRILPDDIIEWDHVHALVHGGAHTWGNLRPLHKQCHMHKTVRDIQANAKVKRILADKPSKHPMKSSGRKIASRPFQKRNAA